MGSLRCPNCGALLREENKLNDDTYKCPYCEGKVDPFSNESSKGERALLERGMLALEDKDFSRAAEFFDNALNYNAKCAQAYLGKLMVVLKVSHREEIVNAPKPLGEYPDFKKALRFASAALTEVLLQYETIVLNKLKQKQQFDEQCRINRYYVIINSEVKSCQELEKLRDELLCLNVLDSKELSKEYSECASLWRTYEQCKNNAPQPSNAILGCGTVIVVFLVVLALFGIYDSFGDDLIEYISIIPAVIILVIAIVFLKKFKDKQYLKQKVVWAEALAQKKEAVINAASASGLKIQIS